ncbi:MAG: hypothetical protein R3217_05270 [Gammaproteobacteria bacterium]|nr:hypothetical protein [Gammaproteobacteria bacterium]
MNALPMRLHLVLALLGMLAVVPAGAAAVSESLVFPYQRLYELKYQFIALPTDDTSLVQVHLKLQSRRDDLPLLEAWIERGADKIDLPVDKRHDFLNLPLSPQLGQENPLVVTNWPRDAARLKVVFELLRPTGQPHSPQSLLLAMRQANAMISARSRLSKERTPQAVGVTLHAAGEQALEITLVDAAGNERKLIGDSGSLDLSAGDLEASTALTSDTAIDLVLPWFD